MTSYILSFAQLSRLLSWRYLLPPTLLYVGVYMYEHLTWTDRAKEQRLKSQVSCDSDIIVT